jgi:carbon-monoxide dehydrogenase medium subunit
LKRFDYLAPNSLDEALTMLSERPEATALAGGTNVLVQLKERHREAGALLSLKSIPELHQLRSGEGLHIGAAITLQHLASDPTIKRDYGALATAAGLIGSIQTRNMATIGGNICNASPSADTAPPLLALQAQVVLMSLRGTRTIALHEFFVGPGETALQSGELLKEIFVPAPMARAASSYARHIPRQAMDISVVGVAAALVLDQAGQIVDARIALGAVAPIPMLASTAAKRLIGRRPSEELWHEAGRMAAREAKPVDDLRASIAYRRHLVDELTQDALRAALSNITDRQEG